jgi:hypothetical protein
MAKDVKYSLRQSETVSPFGPGAITDVSGASLMAPDMTRWNTKHAEEIACDRLSSKLGGGRLLAAPTISGPLEAEKGALEYSRFPEWRFCERCERMTRKTMVKKGKYTNECSCGGALVPMRYVAACEGGSHLQDVPWPLWVHRGRDENLVEEQRLCRADDQLKFVRSSDRGEGLGSMFVRCMACRRDRSLAALVGRTALTADGLRCLGKQPWRGSAMSDCEHPLVAKQRGATSNYLAEIVAAIDIPEGQASTERDLERIRTHDAFHMFVQDNGGLLAEMLRTRIAQDLGVPENMIDEAARTSDGNERPILGLKDGEWLAFKEKLENGRDEETSEFIVDGRRIITSSDVPASAFEVFTHVGQVRRLRVVRALQGFRRHGQDARLVPADPGEPGRTRRNYPALELFGEGIFLRLDEDRIRDWESRPDVQHRAQTLVHRLGDEGLTDRLDHPEPRFLALHTLAHLLIRRLAFASGYASAALQERIYASTERGEPMAGILIYTAAGDAQGTLGGLVRLGAEDKLMPLLLAAVSDAEVCSNDPVCIESDRQGSSNLNLSACHGCALISETSCENRNLLLDRQLLFGGMDVERGLLQQVLDDLRIMASSTR